MAFAKRPCCWLVSIRASSTASPCASLACKNCSLTDDREDYQLVIGFDENTESQDILDTTVTSCYDFYRAVADHAWSGSTYPSLKNMRQAAMTYKLGRAREVPVDTLSFSYFHKAVREKLLLDICNDPLNPKDGGWQEEFIQVGLNGDAYIKYLFLNIVSRWPTDTELTTLRQIIEDRGYAREERLVHRAMIVMDYLSRLSETYHMNALDR